ncbi:MAG: DUF3576 domain-containing protein [Caulobacteraceae bacterium]|nr:DUF3576 domain-containing protein [Caulobacteraceae bacterium]
MAVRRKASVMIAALGAAALAGCAHHESGPQAYVPPSHGLFGGHHATAPVPVIGVNSYLWRATLDTLAFMPLASADPYGGVIITDWYVNPEKTDERFKCTVYILDTRLRADGLNVTVFKQVKDPSGAWVDATAADETSTEIENAILTRARQLRLSNVNS